MAYKISLNYSPNFDSKKRRKNQIKFIIFHYTGMKSEKAAIKRLTNFKSEVSCNYFIKRNGEIITMVPDLYIAWHAGKSSWRKYHLLNKDSIGIEIANPGHRHGYKRFSNSQIKSLTKLSRSLIKKYRINLKNILGHSDIAPQRKKDPGEKFPWEYLAKKNIGLWHDLNKKLLYKNRKIKIDINQKKTFIKNLNKIGYSIQKSKKLEPYSEQNFNLITKAFQRRFRQDLISGTIDKECLIISCNLVKKLN
ncbi:N-acetylmuramoyl-L-alanine amidase [Candidatus Pelagibacter bacterium nBUS_49]|uniref:N-acetylmuramoyl-L-alanine amidase n=1 Tax=Candidatus Pelagibacter bacterium nBUS_49 TaxID=3374196 RepID=UPI003EBF6933